MLVLGNSLAPDTASSWWLVAITGISVLAAWFTGLATAFAAGVALWLGWRDRRERLRFEERKQAGQISVWLNVGPGIPSGTFAIANHSDAPIYDVVLGLGDSRQGHEEFFRVRETGDELSSAKTIPPGRWEVPKSLVRFEGGGMGLTVGAAAYFRDANGATWLLGASGNLTMVPGTPLSQAGLSLPYTSWQIPLDLEQGPADRARRRRFAEMLSNWAFESFVARVHGGAEIEHPSELYRLRIATREVSAEALDAYVSSEVGERAISGLTDEFVTEEWSYIANTINLWVANPELAVENIDRMAELHKDYPRPPAGSHPVSKPLPNYDPGAFRRMN